MPGDAHVDDADDRRSPDADRPCVPRSPRPARQPLVLWVENLSVSFDGFKALDDVTLTLDRGELRCLIGPNGAGKTTLMDVHHRQDPARQRRRLPRAAGSTT